MIELSIALIVIGLIAVPFIILYNNEVEQLKENQTRSAFADVRNAIDTFVTVYGSYPVPAALNTREGDANYGAQGNLTPATCASANWFTTDGMCITGGANPVLIGGVPFDALGLNTESAHDYWGNKIIYAVAASQADPATYARGAGAIIVVGLDPNRNVVPIANPAAASTSYADDTRDMVLVSTGGSGRGGYSREGALISPCVGAGPENEDENCDMDNVFLVDKNMDIYTVGGVDIRETGSHSKVEGNGYYDDLVFDQDSIPLDIWFQNAASPTFAVSTASRIGVGTPNPQARLHVAGDIQANQNIMSDEICNANGANCFNPIIIAGNEPQMDCSQNSLPNNEAVVLIGNSQVFCASPVDISGNALDGRAFVLPNTYGRTNCLNTGKLMAGIDAGGDPICATP